MHVFLSLSHCHFILTALLFHINKRRKENVKLAVAVVAVAVERKIK